MTDQNCLNRSGWNPGDIVYWMHLEQGFRPTVHWGRVDEVFHDVLCVDYLEPYERRLVRPIHCKEAVPIDEFQSEERFRKLPKDWTYNTELFEVIWADLCDDWLNTFLNVSNSEQIQEYYDKGYLVKSSSIFSGEITADITKEGYRIIKHYPAWYVSSSHKRQTATLNYNEAFHTWQEAKDKCNEVKAEYERQANLSDYDWSVEQIDKTLGFWSKLYGKTEDEVKAVRDRLLALDNVEDLEVRHIDGGIQWKYWQKKKWHNIEK